MQVTHEIELNGTPKQVWDFFDNEKNLEKWHPNLVSFTHVKGSAGTKGAVSELTYLEGKRVIVLTETIESHEAPKHFIATYTTADDSVVNRVANFFEQKGSKTIWHIEADFEFKGFVMKLVSRFLERSIHKRTLDDMYRFKDVFEAEQAAQKKSKKTKKPKAKKGKKKK